MAHQTNTNFEADELRLTGYVSKILGIISEFLKKKLLKPRSWTDFERFV